MKKAYIIPSAESLHFTCEGLVAASQGGVDTGSKFGNEFNGDDVSYSNLRDDSWDEED